MKAIAEKDYIEKLKKWLKDKNNGLNSDIEENEDSNRNKKL